MAELGSGSGSDFPTSLDTDSTLEQDLVTTVRADVPNDLAEAIVNIETFLGTKAGTRWFVNAKAYGATGDGTTDDTTALQSGINATPTHGCFLITGGTFKVTSALTGKSNITILLLGKLLITDDTAIDGVIQGDTLTNFNIFGFGHGKIIGPTNSTNEVQAIYLTSVDHCTVAGIYIEGVASGVSLYTCSHCTVRNINGKSIRGQYADASARGNLIQLYGSDHIDVSDLVTEDSWKANVYLSYGGTTANTYININNVVVSGTSGSTVSSGVALRAAKWVNVNNVATDGCHKGVLIEHYSSSSDGDDLHYININNLVADSAEYGIMANDDGTGNDITNLHISNPVITNANDRSIYLRDVSDFSIVRGKDYSPTNYGIYIDGCDGGEIDGYKVVGSGKEGIYLTGTGAGFRLDNIKVRNAGQTTHNTYHGVYVGANITDIQAGAINVEATNAALAHKYAVANFAADGELILRQVIDKNSGTGVLFENTSGATRGMEIRASTTWNPGNIANNSYETKAITVTGAAKGDLVTVGFTQIASGWELIGQVVGANSVEVRLWNRTGGAVDLASGTLYVKVTKK